MNNIPELYANYYPSDLETLRQYKNQLYCFSKSNLFPTRTIIMSFDPWVLHSLIHSFTFSNDSRLVISYTRIAPAADL